MMMDEPFRGLDAMTRELVQEYYVGLFEEHRITNLFVTSELEEAIFLADRLMILSNRPARVRTVMEIELPRPRKFSVLTSREYLHYKREALEILHEEAMKAFFSSCKTSVADFLEAYAEQK
jgi:NitT/TauT family transport system ATP-binding protein